MNPAAVTCAVLQFMEMWILPQFHGRDMLPSNVSAAMEKVKAGLAHKVGWAQLIWDLVRDEILELPTRDDKKSYFGVHLLRLIWVKDPDVFGTMDRLVDMIKKLIQEEVQRQPQMVNNLSKLVGPGDETSTVVQVQQQNPLKNSKPWWYNC